MDVAFANRQFFRSRDKPKYASGESCWRPDSKQQQDLTLSDISKMFSNLYAYVCDNGNICLLSIREMPLFFKCI